MKSWQTSLFLPNKQMMNMKQEILGTKVATLSGKSGYIANVRYPIEFEQAMDSLPSSVKELVKYCLTFKRVNITLAQAYNENTGDNTEKGLGAWLDQVVNVLDILSQKFGIEITTDKRVVYSQHKFVTFHVEPTE